MEVVVLRAGIFPDAETVERALLLLPADCTQAVVDVSQAHSARAIGTRYWTGCWQQTGSSSSDQEEGS